MTKKNKILVLGGMIGAFMVAGLVAQVSGQMQAWKQKRNNNHLIEIQETGGSYTNSGEVEIAYYSHSAFKITSPQGVTLMVDPWRNDPSGAWGVWYKLEFPITQVDIGTSTHAHFDHDALDRLEAGMLLDRLAGTFELGDMKITAIADKHVCKASGKIDWSNWLRDFDQNPCPPNNYAHMDNSLLLIETGGLRLLMWGDNRPDPPERVWNQIQDIDVAFLPVDGSGHILNYEQANAVMQKLNAKIVIPHHYLVGSTTYMMSTLEPATDWVKQHEHTMLEDSAITVSPDSLKDRKGYIMYFGDHNQAVS